MTSAAPIASAVAGGIGSDRRGGAESGAAAPFDVAGARHTTAMRNRRREPFGHARGTRTSRASR